MIPQVQAPSPISLHSQAGTRLHLPDCQRDAWLKGALALQYPDYHDLDAWMDFRSAAARLAARHLPAAIQRALQEFFSPAGADYLVVEGLPIDPQLPSVPLSGLRPAQKQAVSEAVIAGLIGHRAEIFSYANEKKGSPIHEVVPIPGFEMTQSNAGRTAMEYHTDGAFLPSRFRPKGLLLLGLLNVDTATLVLLVEQLMEAASPSLLDALSKPWYRHRQPASFSGSALPNPGPVLWRGPYGFAQVAAASSTIEPLNPAAEMALRDFNDLCANLTPTRVVIAPGTALLFRNNRVLHGRESVTGDRWLQRVYFTESLEPFRTATHANPRAFCFDAERLLQL